MRRERADILLVKQGLADSVDQARLLIMAGRVRVGTSVLVKPATLFSESTCIFGLASNPNCGVSGKYKVNSN